MAENQPATKPPDHVQLAEQLRRSWRAGQRPDVGEFVAAAGTLAADRLAVILRVDQEERWAIGERTLAETYLLRFPFLAEDTESALDLVYAEYLLRERLHEPPQLDEYERRFPELAAVMRQQVELHQAMANEEGLLPASSDEAEECDKSGDQSLGLSADCGAVTSTAASHFEVPGYEILAELGRGGVGLVYKARHLPLKRLVALKILLDGGHARPEQVRRFRAEAQAAARLVHPNIVQIFEVGQHGGQPYLALEYVDGGSLAQVCGRVQPPGWAAALVETLARAVQCAHDHGILHRDLKPANVLLQTVRQRDEDVPTDRVLIKDQTNPSFQPSLDPSSFVPKITDFGLAKLLSAEFADQPAATIEGDVLGTPSYMAPEQAWGRWQQVSAATDVYSLGAILYELLTARPPFLGDTPFDIIEQLRRDEPASPARILRGLPPDLETICLKCLEKDPHNRYSSAAALADDLARFQANRPILARRVALFERVWRWCRRNRLVAALSAAVALLGVGLAVALPVLRVIHAERDAAIRAERIAEQNLQRALLAERESSTRAHLAQARAYLRSARSGHRNNCLEELAAAARLDPPPELHRELRNVAISALTVTDAQLSWERTVSTFPFKGSQCDYRLQRYAFVDFYGTGEVCIRRMRDDCELARLPHPGVDFWHAAVEFSPSGEYLAACYWPRGSGDTLLHVWHIANRELVTQRHVRCGSVVVAAAFHPNGRWLVFPSPAGELCVWDLVSRCELKRFALGFAPYSILLDRSGQRVAANGFNTTEVRILDLETGSELAAWKTDVGTYAMAWSDDGQLLASAHSDQRTYIWHVPRGELVSILQSPGHLPIYAQFDRTSRLLATAAWDGTTRLWDAVTGDELARMPGALWRFTADGRQLAVLNADKIGIHDLAHGNECRRLHHGLVGNRNEQPSQIQLTNGVDFGPDGRWLATAGSDGVRLWDLGTDRELAYLETAHCDAVRFHPDGKSLITAAWGGVYQWPIRDESTEVPATDNVMIGTQLTDKDAGRYVIGPPRLLVPLDPDRVSSAIDWLPGGCGLVVNDAANARVLIVEVESSSATTEPVALPSEHQRLTNVAASRDGKWIAAGGWKERGIQIWNVQQRRIDRVLSPDDVRGEPIFYAYFSPDCRWLVCATHSETATGYHFFRVGSWEEQKHRFIPAEAVSMNMPFSPDGRLLALNVTPDEILLIDAEDQEIGRLSTPQSNITWPVAFSPDGTQLAAIDHQKRTVNIWDLRRIKARLAELGLAWEAAKPGHDRPATAAAGVIEDGRTHAPALLHVTVDSGQMPAWRAATLRHREASPHTKLAQEHAAAHRWPNAIAEFKQALALNADDVTTQNNFAWLLATCPVEQFRDPTLAMQHARRATELAPDADYVWNTLGVAQYRAGRWRAAIESLLRAEAITPDQYFGHNAFFLAMAHWQLGEHVPAREWHVKASQWLERHKTAGSPHVEELSQFWSESDEMLQTDGHMPAQDIEVPIP